MPKNLFRSAWFYTILIVLLTVPLYSGLLGHHLINAHDSMAGYVRASAMDRYMGHGQFLVRWAPGLNWGHGYPMFNFYPPFFSFLAMLFSHLTHNMVAAINAACILMWILSAVGMFLLAREFWGPEGGMLSALLYAYAPYHIIDLYVRGAFAEFSSFAFFPFILLAILKMSRKGGLGAFLLGTTSISGLSLTHNIMSMLFFPIAVLFMFYLFFTEKRSAWIVAAIGMFVIGLMMSSFFWLPALMEKQFLNLRFLTSMRYDFHKSFISLKALFWPFDQTMMDHVTFQAGVIHSMLCLAGMACLSKIFKINKQAGLIYVFFLIVGAAAIFCTLPFSHLFWENISMLRFTQLPWRFLTIIVFVMSFLGGGFFLLIENHWAKRTLLGLISLFIILISLNTSAQLSFVNDLTSVDNFVAMGEGEYTPKWVDAPPMGFAHHKFEVFNGLGRMAWEKPIDPVHYEALFQAIQPTTIYFHTFYFPGWRVYVDGQSINPYLYNPYGFIAFNLDPGIHDVNVIFGSTPVRTAGMVISWIGLVLLLVGAVWIKIKNKL